MNKSKDKPKTTTISVDAKTHEEVKNLMDAMNDKLSPFEVRMGGVVLCLIRYIYEAGHTEGFINHFKQEKP